MSPAHIPGGRKPRKPVKKLNKPQQQAHGDKYHHLADANRVERLQVVADSAKAPLLHKDPEESVRSKSALDRAISAIQEQ